MTSFRLPTFCIALFVTLLSAHALTAQTQLQFQQTERIRVVERTNLTRRDNDRYTGLLSREVTGLLSQSDEDPARYAGRFFSFERLRRDLATVARTVDQSIETTVEIRTDTLFPNVPPYPRYYGIPFLPEFPVSAGETWDAWGAMRLQPNRDQPPMILPVIVRYRYIGLEEWNGEPAHRVEAQFATRYPLRSNDPDGPTVVYDGPINQVTGSHRITVMLPTSGTQTLFVRDEMEELYRFADGSTTHLRGHVLLFFNGLGVESREAIAQSVETELAERAVADVAVEQTDTGVRLRLENVQFLPDQAVLLPGESARLDQIARVLNAVTGARFLIVGHTADVGTQESQQALSQERATAIAAELVARGIDPNLLDVEGRAGREPIAPNDTESGRARNRRVEIVVLEL